MVYSPISCGVLFKSGQTTYVFKYRILVIKRSLHIFEQYSFHKVNGTLFLIPLVQIWQYVSLNLDFLVCLYITYRTVPNAPKSSPNA